MTAAADTVTIRPARPADVDLVHRLIRELAACERAQQPVTGTAAQLGDALFGPDPAAEALIAEELGEPVGLAVFYRTFSTWECRPGIWLEDLYVPDRHRRSGIGRALLTELARLTVQRGFTRLEWHALDWNDPALRFYARLDAERLSAWELHRLSGDALRRVAQGGEARPTGSTAGQRDVAAGRRPGPT